jgi:hypothetical protein
MARNMVGGADAQIFRVVVVHHHMMRNPAFPGAAHSEPFSIPTGETYERIYGPYNTLGAARGQMTANTAAYGGGLLDYVASCHIEKAETTWKDVA